MGQGKDPSRAKLVFGLVGGGCLLLLLGSVAICGGGIFFAEMAMKKSIPYNRGLEAAAGSEEVKAAFGSAPEAGFFVQGKISTSNGKAQADFTIPLHGAKGDGKLTIRAHKNGSAWTFDSVSVEPPGGGSPIDLTEDVKHR